MSLPPPAPQPVEVDCRREADHDDITSVSYVLEASCHNCQSRFRVRLSWGEPHPQDVRCPACGVRSWCGTSWHGMPGGSQ